MDASGGHDDVYARILRGVKRHELGAQCDAVLQKEARSIQRRLRLAADSLVALQELSLATQYLRQQQSDLGCYWETAVENAAVQAHAAEVASLQEQLGDVIGRMTQRAGVDEQGNTPEAQQQKSESATRCKRKGTEGVSPKTVKKESKESMLPSLYRATVSTKRRKRSTIDYAELTSRRTPAPKTPPVSTVAPIEVDDPSGEDLSTKGHTAVEQRAPCDRNKAEGASSSRDSSSSRANSQASKPAEASDNPAANSPSNLREEDPPSSATPESPLELKVLESESESDGEFPSCFEAATHLQSAEQSVQLERFPSIVQQLRTYLFERKHLTVAELDGYLFAHKRMSETETDDVARAIQVAISMGMRLPFQPQIELALADLFVVIEQLEAAVGGLPAFLSPVAIRFSSYFLSRTATSENSTSSTLATCKSKVAVLQV